MKRKFFSVTLIATSLLLAIGVFGCSDDKDDKGSTVSCEQLSVIATQCENKYDSALEACNYNEECEDGVYDQMNSCVESQVCAGMSSEACEEFYDEQCDF